MTGPVEVKRWRGGCVKLQVTQLDSLILLYRVAIRQLYLVDHFFP